MSVKLKFKILLYFKRFHKDLKVFIGISERFLDFMHKTFTDFINNH